MAGRGVTPRRRPRGRALLSKARTYHNGNPIVPGWVRTNQTWWYTHDRLRKASRLLERLSQAGTLVTYLRSEFASLQIASTTNRIDGGTDAQLRLLLRAHRAISEEHRKPPATKTIPAPSATAPDSAQKKDSGPAKDGPDAPDTIKPTRILAVRPCRQQKTRTTKR